MQIGFAVVATVGWALTPIAINRGLTITADDVSAISFAWLLALALTTGLVLSTVFSVILGVPLDSLLRIRSSAVIYAAMAGVFLFPVHNGIYYISSQAYERSEVALQFEQLSPIVTVPLGFAAGEAITSIRLLAFILVSIGTIYLFRLTVGGNLGLQPFLLGMVFMLSGSIGGFFTKLATIDMNPLVAILQALIAGVIVQILVAGLWTTITSAEFDILQSHLQPFIAHGVLSFGIAYPSYFYSIRLIGLSSTSLVVVSSPIVALSIILPVRYLLEDSFLHEASTIKDRSLLAASLVVFAGSLLIAVPI